MTEESSYIPEKVDYIDGVRTEVPITSEDTSKTVLIKTGGPEGPIDISTRVAYGLPNELNRDPNGWFWAEIVKDGETQWSHFRGNDICVDVSLKSWNERRVDGWKGFDEVRGLCSATISFNRIPVWEETGNDACQVLRRVEQVVPELKKCSALIDYINGDQSTLIGRKIYWRDQPAVITSFIGDQGCVMIKADPGPWVLPAWRAEEYLSHEDFEEEVKADILSPHIWWWRDSIRSAFPEGIEPKLITKQILVLSKDGELVTDEAGLVKTWNTLEEAKQDAYDVFSTPAPEPPVAADPSTGDVVTNIERPGTPLPYARFTNNPN